MNKKNNLKIPILLASILGATSIIFGAFSAHALENLADKNILSLHQLTIFEKAVKYQMYHSIVLLILSLFNFIQNKPIFKQSIYTIFSGILLFSYSLYWIALQNILGLAFPHALFWITPLGGLFMIIGWLLIPYELLKKNHYCPKN